MHFFVDLSYSALMACDFLPGSNFAPFERVKVQVSNSAEFFPKSAPWRILQDLAGVVRVKELIMAHRFNFALDTDMCIALILH